MKKQILSCLASVYSLIRRTVVVCTEFDSGEISGRAESVAHLIVHPFGDRARSCLTSAFESEYSCSTPPTLLNGDGPKVFL